jgi:hypothetical protein
MFEWDGNNLRKIRVHGIRREEAEESLENNPIVASTQEIAVKSVFCVTRKPSRADCLGSS